MSLPLAFSAEIFNVVATGLAADKAVWPDFVRADFRVGSCSLVPLRFWAHFETYNRNVTEVEKAQNFFGHGIAMSS